MIKIDKDNVEAFYLDYLEGNLNTEDSVLLLAFIKDNPEISNLFEDTEGLLDYKLEAQDLSFGDIDELKSFPCDEEEICLSNIDFWLIAKSERTLNADQVLAVDSFVKSNKLEKTEAYIAAAYLKPNLNEIFFEKTVLKKKTGVILPLFTRITAIAAIFVFFWLAFSQKSNISPQYVSRGLEKIDLTISKYDHSNLAENNDGIIIETNVDHNNLAALSKNQLFQLQTKNNSSPNSDKKANLADFFSESFKNISASSEISFPPKALPESINISDLFSDYELALSSQEQSDKYDENLVAEHKKPRQEKSELKEYYKPVTNTLSNLTQLDMSYKKLPEGASQSHTLVQIGNFSFERKKRK